MAQKKILLLSVSAGAGHVRVAEAIRSRAADAFGDDVNAIHLDALAYVTPCLRKVYADLYISLVKRAPGVWSHVYKLTDEASPDGWANRLRRRVERHDCKALIREIAAIGPDAIVCTHFLPAEILSHQIAAGRLNCPVWVQVTDFDLHRMWVHRHMAGYFAANEEVAFRMRSLGIPPEAAHVTGIPIMPAFSQPLDRGECAGEIGIDPALTTLLLMGGGAGLGGLAAVARRLLELPGHFQLIVLAGKNAAELAALQGLAVSHPGRLVVQGYTNQVERLMTCADLVITKPGGSTTAECLAMGLPMIVHAAIPGQEERNANFLLEHGAALKAFDMPSLEYRISDLLAHPAKLREMGEKAKALGRPDAASRVIDIVLGNAEQEKCKFST